MIDFHTHVLPAIDDGSQSVEQSQEMLRLLKEDGVNTVLCTSHFYWQERSIDEFLRERERAYASLSPTDMRLIPAAEVEFGEFTIDYTQFERLKIGDTSYILLELPYTAEWSPRLFSNIRALAQETGLIPVIAHVDRYLSVKRNPKLINELLAIGCLLQVNTGAVLRSKNGSLVDCLFKQGVVSALGSDCHNTEGRRPLYGAAIVKLAQRYGEECVELVQRRMAAMLCSERVSAPTACSIKKFFGRYW